MKRISGFQTSAHFPIRLAYIMWIGVMLPDHSGFCQQVDEKTKAQSDLPEVSTPTDFDSTFVGKFKRKNDIRSFYGAQAISLEYGSRHQTTPNVPTIYNNVNNFVGIGLTYKIFDADVSFSLPKTRILNEDLQNLSQFMFALSSTGREWVVRGYYYNMTGMITSDPENQFESKPDVQQLRTGVQLTYIVNHRKYSYRAAVWQNEIQKRTAGSFLIKVETFYRSLGASSRIVPASLDVPQVYGDQVGLQYVNAPGLLVMPGYGFTFIPKRGNFYISPMIFGGGGVAFNYYKGEFGKFVYTNWEMAGMATLNLGYRDTRMYVNVRASDEINYTPLNPAYFISSSLRISITAGYRFFDFKKSRTKSR